MQQWEEFNRGQLSALKRELEIQTESVSCKTCSSTWFESVKAYQFKADHNLILGQEVPTRLPNAIPFVLMRCLRCGDLLEPRILHNTRDLAGTTYDSLLDTLEGKGDTRKEKKDEVQSKGQQPIPATK